MVGEMAMAGAGLAKNRFEQTMIDIRRLDEVNLLLMFECDDWKPPQVRTRSETSDPTANRACYNVDELEEKLASLRREQAELQERIGQTLQILAAVRDGLGDKYADVLEWRYIDGWTWKRIEKDCKVKRHIGYYLVEVACDWVDSLGVTRLLQKDFEI